MTTTNHKTIASYFEEYLLECEYSKGLRPKTIKTYTDVFNFFSKLMPEVKYMVATGKTSNKELEKTISAFYYGE